MTGSNSNRLNPDHCEYILADNEYCTIYSSDYLPDEVYESTACVCPDNRKCPWKRRKKVKPFQDGPTMTSLNDWADKTSNECQTSEDPFA